MKFHRICLINFIRGISGLLFLSQHKLDYLDAVKYCASFNGNMSGLHDAMTARNKCELVSQDVWYKREKTDPDIMAPLPFGMCYVYGTYWKPCRNKYFFFCHDSNSNDSSISCSSEGQLKPEDLVQSGDFGTYDVGDDDPLDIHLAKYNSDTSPSAISAKMTPLVIDFNTYELIILGGAVFVSILVTLAIVAIVVRCRKPVSSDDDGYDSPVQLRFPKLPKDKLEAPWYESTRETKIIPQHIYETAEKYIYDVPSV